MILLMNFCHNVGADQRVCLGSAIEFGQVNEYWGGVKGTHAGAPLQLQIIEPLKLAKY